MATPKYFIWEYRTLVEVGAGCRTFAPERFTEMGCKRVGMITDHGLVEAGVANMVSDIFKIQGGLQLIDVYDRIQPDATMNVINDCARWYRENALDGMLVVGGGSVMDSAKGVKYLLGTGGTCIQEPLADNVLFHFRPNARPLNVPSIFIPTTAGTGSEVSTVAVIYNEETKLKTNLIHPYISAEIALLDPELTIGLSPYMTAATGLDALGHALEGLSSSQTNFMADSLGIQAIKLIMQYLPIAVNDGKNMEARMVMLGASNMAIMGFSMAGMVAPAHNIAHAVGAKLRIPHGEAVGVAIPSLMEHFPEYYLPIADKLADAFGVQGLDAGEIIAAAQAKIVDLMKKCSFKTGFSVALNEQERKQILQAIKTDPSKSVYIPDYVLMNIINTCFPSE
ncbi:MAG: iron-containing alcohol dehydrogenase [Syntrophomonadaceae bacterium]|jgi:alcohol dehydrogenase class IV